MSAPPPRTERRATGYPDAQSGAPSAQGKVRNLMQALAPPEPDRSSIFGEILDWMAAPLLLLWPLSVVLTFFMARTIADQPFDRALEQKVEAIAQRIEARLAAAGSLRDGLAALGGILEADSAENASANGTVFSNSTGLATAEHTVGTVAAGAKGEPTYHLQVRSPEGTILGGDPDLPPHADGSRLQSMQVVIRSGNYHGEELRIATRGLQHPDNPGTVAVLQVAETAEQRENFANDIIRGLILPQFAVLPIAVALVWVGLSRGLRPLEKLRERVRERPANDLSPLPLHGSPEEVAPLLQSFNELIERLGRVLQAQERFIANAAHQMKTPLAGIRTQAELALRTDDPGEMRISLEFLTRSSERAAHVLNQLLSLARTESLGVPGTEFEVVNLAPSLRKWACTWADQAIARGQDFGIEIDGGCEESLVRIHPTLVAELLNNLVDNAVRYTPRGSVITVRLRPLAKGLQLEVEDNGPGIPCFEQALVFERFYRAAGGETAGSGLGLAIVREIAERHRLPLRLESPAHPGAAPGTAGCRFSLLFPLEAGSPLRVPTAA